MGLFVSGIGLLMSGLVFIELDWTLFAIRLLWAYYWGRLLCHLLLEWIGCCKLLINFLMILLIDC